MSNARDIRLTEEEDGLWSAIDKETGVASSGDTRAEALEMLDEAVSLHTGEAGEPVTDEDLEELGLDPNVICEEANVPDVPWFEDPGETAQLWSESDLLGRTSRRY